MTRHLVADLSELEEGRPLIVTVRGRSVGLIKTDGTVYAIRNVCPHKGAPVCRGRVGGTMLPSEPATFAFGLQGMILQCPWHGWEFDLRTGKTMCPKPDRQLTAYRVIVEGQQVHVEI